jgi:hypothetical protein
MSTPNLRVGDGLGRAACDARPPGGRRSSTYSAMTSRPRRAAHWRSGDLVLRYTDLACAQRVNVVIDVCQRFLVTFLR